MRDPVSLFTQYYQKPMGLFTPRYLKQSRALLEAASRMLHHHRDLLNDQQILSLQGTLATLRDGIRQKDRKVIQDASNRLEERFSQLIPSTPHAAWKENIEAIVVAVAIAVGVQAYFLKPFKIPTGSMQPTLYGMTGHPTTIPTPSPLARAVDFIQLGRTHLDLKATEHEQVLELKERTILNFFTFTDVLTTAGTHTIFAPLAALRDGFGVTPPYTDREGNIHPGRTYEAGESIVHGYVQAGDQVFVDRMTYQFKKPERSNVFVFTTAGIRRIEMGLDPLLGSEFYIKRLAGVPGDTLRIDSPQLYLNGSVATQSPFLRVMSCENGYNGYSNPSPNYGAIYLTTPDETFTVPSRCFFALGDNSYNSSDSRYWGIVPEHNVIGRGFFVYWPFSERWGFIH